MRVSVIAGLLLTIIAGYFILKELNTYSEAKKEFFSVIRKGDLAGVKKILDSGQDINVRDGVGQTALHIAAYKGTPEIVDLLIDSGANIDAEDNRGGKPIHWAAIKGSIDNVEVLIKRGAKLNVRDKNGDTPLHWAVGGIGVLPQRKYITVAYMLNQKADPNIKNEQGKTPLKMAQQKDDEMMINLLRPETDY